MNIYNIVPYIRYSVNRKCLDGNWKIESRTIPDHEFVLITDGKGEITIEGKIYEARQGLLFYFYPGLIHALKSSGLKPMSFCAIHFSYGHIVYNDNKWTIENGDVPLPLNFISDVNSYPILEELMKEITRNWSTRNNAYELMCNGLFLQLFHHILSGNHVNYSSRFKVQKIIQYINQNIHNDLSIKELAAFANLSSDYLTSMFKSYTGLAPIRYINKCKIDAAKDLLINEDLRIKEIALKVGFKDEFYFSRMFKKLEGISPKDFRRKISFPWHN